jgi:hypothetical protein
MRARAEIENRCGPGATVLSASLNAREVDDSRLDALYAPKDIARQFRGDVKLRPVPPQERFAQRRMQGAKGDRVDRRAVPRTQTGAHMIGPNRLSESDLLLRQSKQGLGVALPEWTSLLHPSQQFETDPSSGDCRIDDQRVVETRGLDGRRQRLIEKGAKVVDLVTGQSHAGGHRMAATLDRQAQIDGAAHRRAEVDAT